MSGELTTDEVRELMGGVVRRWASEQMRLAGIQPKYRQPGPTGQYVWDADEVRAFLESRPGQGARTDLQEQ